MMLGKDLRKEVKGVRRVCVALGTGGGTERDVIMDQAKKVEKPISSKQVQRKVGKMPSQESSFRQLSICFARTLTELDWKRY